MPVVSWWFLGGLSVVSRRRHADVMLASCSSLAFIYVHHELIYEKKREILLLGLYAGFIVAISLSNISFSLLLSFVSFVSFASSAFSFVCC